MCICIPARSASLPISACMNFSSTSHFCRQDYSQILFDYAILQLACGPLEVVPLVVALPEPRLWPLRRGTGASFSFLSYLFDWKSCRHPFFPPVLAITLTIVFIFYSKRGRKSWIGEVQCRRYDGMVPFHHQVPCLTFISGFAVARVEIGVIGELANFPTNVC